MASCSSVIPYKASDVSSFDEAKMLIEKHTYSQHKLWRPDYIQIGKDYMLWGFGQVSHTNAGAVSLGSAAVGHATTTTRGRNERLYYSDIKSFQVISWKRKFKQWYVASVLTNRGQSQVCARRRFRKAKYYTRVDIAL